MYLLETHVVDFPASFFSCENFFFFFLSLTCDVYISLFLPSWFSWRLPPRHLEERDGYFTKTMERVESMYKDNDDLPIILACHSMGTYCT